MAKRKPRDKCRDPKDGRGTANYAQQCKGAKAAQSGAEQICAVNDADRVGTTREREAYDHTREEERQRQGEGGEHEHRGNG